MWLLYLCAGALSFGCQYIYVVCGVCIILLGWVATRGHSQPQTQQIAAQMPLWKLCWIFSFYLCGKYLQKNGRQVRTVLWRKSEFVWAGKSFWLAGDAGCWIIAAGWFQSQHCRPNFHYQFVGRPPTAPYTPAYHILLRYANFSALHIDYTDSENSQYRRVDRCNIFSKAGQGSVMGGAICPDVLAWRDTGSSAAVALSST